MASFRDEAALRILCVVMEAQRDWKQPTEMARAAVVMADELEAALRLGNIERDGGKVV
jgi:hypothetical protein